MRILSTSVRRSRYNLIGKVTLHTFQSLLFLQVLLSLLLKNRGNCSFTIWYNIAFFSIIHWISQINLPPNEDLDFIFQHISQIFQTGIFPELCPDQQSGLSILNRTRIESKGFINNSKDLLFPYSFVCCIAGFLFFSERVIKVFKIGTNFKNFIWNLVIRINLLVYLEFLTYGFINIYYFSEVTTCSIINVSLSVIFTILGASWMIVLPIILNKHLSNCSSPEDFYSKKSISTLTHEFKPTLENSNYQYYTIFIIYRFLFSVSIVFLQNLPFIQISLIFIFQLIISTTYIVTYIASINPYQIKSDFFSMLISEFLMLLFIFFTALRTLPTLEVQTHEYITIISISVLWLNEFTILGRFALSICSTPSPSQSHLPSPNLQDLTVQNVKTPQHPIQDLKNLENSNTINNNTEFNEKIIITLANQYYKNLETNTENHFNEKIVTPKSSGHIPQKPSNIRRNINPSPSSNGLLRKIEVKPPKNLKLPLGVKIKLKNNNSSLKNQDLRVPEYFFPNSLSGSYSRSSDIEKVFQDIGKKNIKL